MSSILRDNKRLVIINICFCRFVIPSNSYFGSSPANNGTNRTFFGLCMILVKNPFFNCCTVYKYLITKVYERNYQCFFKTFKIYTSFEPQDPLRSFLLVFKCKHPKSDLKSVIYKIPYHNCNSIYICETSLFLKTSLKEHTFKKGTLRSKIVIHALDTDLEFTNASVLRSD